ncbi:hypothetical protein DW886_23745 [Enterocloster aldenensis]|uniref:hypothetical protein n=1 Tax=Enterocloster aldenensis TaxID=358742 RepID=UPI000E4B1C0F|nr:hypothetical protein DW886_23745 [Enterocloster aldenensis]
MIRVGEKLLELQEPHIQQLIALAEEAGVSLTSDDFTAANQPISDEQAENISGGYFHAATGLGLESRRRSYDGGRMAMAKLEIRKSCINNSADYDFSKDNKNFKERLRGWKRN